MDDENVKDDVEEFMKDYNNVHYAFKEDDGYQYIQFNFIFKYFHFSLII